jgi:hypothetical protein
MGKLYTADNFVRSGGTSSQYLMADGSVTTSSPGTSGTSGTSGVNGENGSSGTSGTSGVNGDGGSSGTTGTSGTSGVNGANGTNGTSGTSVAVAGTTNYVAKFTSATTIGNTGAMIFDDGTNVGIGITNPLSKLNVNGDIKIEGSNSLFIGGGASVVPTWGISPNINNLEISGVATNTTGNVTFLNLGNVGIGTTTPGFKLDVNGPAKFNNYIRLSDGNNPWDIGSIYNYTNSDLFFSMNGSEKMRINTYGQVCIGYSGASATGTSSLIAAGNVGIGTTNPSEMLEVQNGGSGAKIKVSNSAGGYASLECSSNATSVAQLSFTNQLSLIGGNVGIGTTSPGAKLDVTGGDAIIHGVTVGIGGGSVSSNTVVGRNALDANSTGSNNICIGSGAASGLSNNASGRVVIGTDLFLTPNLDDIGNDELVISQYNQNAASFQLPHIYVPKPLPIPNGATTDVIAFDLGHYVGAFVEYIIYLDDGSDYAMGTVYMAWKSSGSGNFRDVRQIEWSNMSDFTFSLGGTQGTTLRLDNTSSNNAWIRITVRAMMTN